MEIRAHREPWLRDMISIRMAMIQGERVHLVEKLRIHALPEDQTQTAVEMEPTITISPTDAQQFMDELWRIGIRPTDGTGSTGQLSATQDHLADMRKLVFNPKP